MMAVRLVPPSPLFEPIQSIQASAGPFLPTSGPSWRSKSLSTLEQVAVRRHIKPSQPLQFLTWTSRDYQSREIEAEGTYTFFFSPGKGRLDHLHIHSFATFNQFSLVGWAFGRRDCVVITSSWILINLCIQLCDQRPTSLRTKLSKWCQICRPQDESKYMNITMITRSHILDRLVPG